MGLQMKITENNKKVSLNVAPNIEVQIKGGGIASGSYEDLTEKPSINGIELIGDKKDCDIGINYLTNVEIQNIINRV